MFAMGAGCSERPKTTKTPEYAFDAARAWQDLNHQVAFGPRVPGSEAHKHTRDWLVQQLSLTTKSVDVQPFTHELRGKTVTMWNIFATFPGVGPAPRERVLLLAHWDSRPTADYDSKPEFRSHPIDGANDGASGVAVLLEIARQLKVHPIQRDVVLLLDDGEDYGPEIDNMLLGVKYYAAHLPKEKPTWGILLDMIGDKDLDIYREPNSEKYAKAVNDRIFRAAHALGYLKSGTLTGFVDSPYKYPIDDDHIPLIQAGIPVADLIDFDYLPWHTTADSVDKCSADSLKIVGATVLYALQIP